MKLPSRLLLATFTLWLATLATASALSVSVVAGIATLRTTDFTTSPYVFVQTPDPTTPPGQNAGGALFAQTPNVTQTRNNGCVDNGVTILVDSVGNCFIRTDKLNIRDFGARGDTRSGFTDGYFTSSTTFASPSAAFTRADIGKHIYIQGAGSSFTPMPHAGNPNVGPHYQTYDTTITGFTAASGPTPAYVTIPAQPTGSVSQMWGSIPGASIIPDSIASPNSQGTGYSVGDVLPLAGGSLPPSTSCSTNTAGGKIAATCAATVQVNAVSVVSATAMSTGGPGVHNTSCTFSGTDGTALSGKLFQVTVSTDASGAISGVVVNNGGYYTGMPSASTAPATGCGFTTVTLAPAFGVAETQMVFNGVYGYQAPGSATQQFPASSDGVDPSNHFCSNALCSGATFNTGSSQQTNIFSVGTDDTLALQAAVAAQTKLASLAMNPTNMNSKVCIYAPAGVYSVLPLNQSGIAGILAANGCVEGDGQQQTIFHIRPNVAGDLFAWHNANQNNSLPFNGSIALLNLNQAGPSCHDFGVEGDRTSSANQNGLVFYGANDYISCIGIQVDYLRGSALRCADPDPGNLNETAQCRESHFRDMRFTRDGDGSDYPVISWHANGGSDGVNNIDISDVDIYNPRGTGMYFTDTAAPNGSVGNADHNIAMARIRWEGSEFSVAGITTDLLQIDGGAPKGGLPTMGGTSNITCLECRWENPYFNASAIHFTSTGSGPPAGTIVLDGRVIGGSSGFGKGVQIDAGNALTLNLSVLNSVDYNLSMTNSAGSSLGNIFLNGYGSEFGWTYNVPATSSGALIGPMQRYAIGANGSAIQSAQPNAANGCTGTRGPGATDLQTDCTLSTQGALGKDSFAGAGQANTAAGNFASISGGQNNVASGVNAAVAGGNGNTVSGQSSFASGTNNAASGQNSFTGGTGAADNGRLATNCWSSGAANSGQSQTCVETLFGTGAGGISIRLTANGASTPSATNTFNISDNTSFSLRVSLTAIDTAVPTTTYTGSWTAILNLSRGSGALTTLLNGSTAMIAPTSYFYSPGTLVPPLPGQLSADTTNGGLSIMFTPPNSDRWHIAARIESTEVK